MKKTFLIFLVVCLTIFITNAQEARNLKFVKVLTISTTKMSVPKGKLWIIQSSYTTDGLPSGMPAATVKSNFKIAYRPITLDGKEVWATFPFYLGEDTTISSSDKLEFLIVVEYLIE